MTPNKEDYLKYIYENCTEVEKLNKEMLVSPPAVTEMIKRMISEGSFW